MNIFRFGAGYWIGAICSTLIGLATLFFGEGMEDMAVEGGQSLAMLFQALTILQWVLLLLMLVGALLSARHFREGRRSHDRNAVIGGILGLLLCGWPCVLILVQSWR